MMTDRFVGPEIGNRECQRELAHVLVATHGYDEALEMCQENGWEGVLDVIFSDRRPTSGAT
jgi:hypothetical protein